MSKTRDHDGRRNGVLFAIMLAAAFRCTASWTLHSKISPHRPLLTHLSVSAKDGSSKNRSNNNNSNKKKISDISAEKLAAAFDELARKEGFDKELSYFAEAATFKDFPKEDDMDERIAAARLDLIPPQPKQKEKTIDISVLGFRKEEDPFPNDEKIKPKIQVVDDAMVCSACGSDFQCTNEKKPGFLPPEKYDYQVKMSKLQELQNLKDKAENDKEWTPEDEVEWLIQTAGTSAATDPNKDINIEKSAEEMGLNLKEAAKAKKVICQRCHSLQNHGKVDNALRPGWTEEPLLSQENFRQLLRPISQRVAVIVALVDIFDFAGSVLPELDEIAGMNPVIVAANKVDLLPASMGPARVENWVRRELEHLGVKSLANVGGAVRLISCKTGKGVGGMLWKAQSLAEENNCDIYVIGAANAGKSTLMNYVLSRQRTTEEKRMTGKLRAGNRNKIKPAITTSPLPGTTLKFIKIDLGDGRSIYDTPGLLVEGTLTQLLTPEELKIAVPTDNVEPVTFRVATGKVVLVGGLAKVELVGDSKPFFLSFFVANRIKIHMTDSTRADDFIRKHVGETLTPPLAPGPERLEQLGEFESHDIVVQGAGWNEAAADIALTGIGWVAVTGAGSAKLRISVPKGINVQLRPPLMPFDIWEYTAKYTGARAVRRTTKSKGNKRRSGVGRN